MKPFSHAETQNYWNFWLQISDSYRHEYLTVQWRCWLAATLLPRKVSTVLSVSMQVSLEQFCTSFIGFTAPVTTTPPPAIKHFYICFTVIFKVKRSRSPGHGDVGWLFKSLHTLYGRHHNHNQSEPLPVDQWIFMAQRVYGLQRATSRTACCYL